MSITVAQYIRNELAKALGSEVTVSDEAIGRSLLVSHMLSTGEMTLKDLIPTAEKHAELLYAVAYEFYQNNKIEKAYCLFAALCAYDPKCIKFLEGWAATSKLLKKYQEATIALFTLTQVDPINLSYYPELAEMLYKLQQPEAAVKCCEAVEKLSKEEPFKSKNKSLDVLVKKTVALRKAFTSKK